jgi:hypothetical protein
LHSGDEEPPKRKKKRTRRHSLRIQPTNCFIHFIAPSLLFFDDCDVTASG